MARPGHLRTQAYRSIFSQACDHGFQFSSMSGLPIIQAHESPPGSLRETHGVGDLHGEEQVAVGFCWCGVFESYLDRRILGQVRGTHTLLCVVAQ